MKSDQVLGVERAGQFVMFDQQFRHAAGLRTDGDVCAIEEVRPQASATPNHAGRRTGAADDRLPLRFQPGEEPIGQPIHVVQ